MKAIILEGFGEVDQLSFTEIPTPELTAGQVLIRSMAISINPVDVKTRAGSGIASKFKHTDPIILGWDVAGIVEETNSSLFKKGDEVFGMVHFPGQGKAYAGYIAAPDSHLALKPANVSFPQAAATTLAALTAWQAFHKHGRIKPGDKVLVHAASGGVGHFAVQLAKASGAYVIGTSSAENKDFVLSLGADEHFDYRSGNFAEHYHDIDIILDTVGGDYVSRSIPVLKKNGFLVSIPGRISEADQKKALETGVTVANILVHSNGDDMKQLADLLESGKLKPHISKVFAFEDMASAHLQLESHRTKGKIVLTF
ncbi:NADP-dependent oxidoreductase [Dyadobacter sp. MSC1_007]|jgi:NADPH:quinone reductase-like Zn-dependent oxidoreductase|uniref:NADP-dependent oxidoreductase n=1 Tax=Dyadobacter sp. MSC1_007 TaxID=2909264 RepID=UPI00202E3C8B|nr:NADP-dependent oxidoreductase [Dyadobacter sp. MSC1_007]